MNHLLNLFGSEPQNCIRNVLLRWLGALALRMLTKVRELRLPWLVRRGLVGELEKLMSFLKKHGARAHPRRDRKEGRYSYAFAPIP